MKQILKLQKDRMISFFILGGVFSGIIAMMEQSTDIQGNFTEMMISSLVCIIMRVIWKISYECIENLGREGYIIHIGVILSIMSFPVLSGAYQDNHYMIYTLLLFIYAFTYAFFMEVGEKIKECYTNYKNQGNCRDYG